jgi:hypothetical protein
VRGATSSERFVGDYISVEFEVLTSSPLLFCVFGCYYGSNCVFHGRDLPSSQAGIEGIGLVFSMQVCTDYGAGKKTLRSA